MTSLRLVTEPADWTVTTHEWTTWVDEDHLLAIRDDVATFGTGGRRHMILEVLAYANDEANALGRTGEATVEYHHEGSVTVADNGRGTDTRRDAAGRPIRKPVMATKDLRFFEAPDPPLLPDGLPRRGMSTVAALSSWLVHENRRGDDAWTQSYRSGVPDSHLRSLPDPTPSGTRVTFLPDERVHGHDWLTEEDLTRFGWLAVTVRD